MHLSTFVKVGFNKKAFKPSVKQIMEMYYDKFRGNNNDETPAPAPGEAGPSGTK